MKFQIYKNKSVPPLLHNIRLWTWKIPYGGKWHFEINAFSVWCFYRVNFGYGSRQKNFKYWHVWRAVVDLSITGCDVSFHSGNITTKNSSVFHLTNCPLRICFYLYVFCFYLPVWRIRTSVDLNLKICLCFILISQGLSPINQCKCCDDITK